MKVQVLQGINFENPITTIKITTDSQPRLDLIDEIKNLHPLFMEEYSTNGNTIIVQSRLPHLWKELAVAINNYSTNEWSYDFAKEYSFDTVIKKQILSMSTIPILRAAHELGYETTQFFIEEGFSPVNAYTKFNRYYNIGIGQESEISISISSTQDTYLAKMTQEDKWLTNTVISRLKLPIAKWEAVDDIDDLEEIFPKYKLPVVIKPSSLTGGHGVTTKIMTLDQAKKAYEEAMLAYANVSRSSFMRRVLIQETAYGDDYRILVIDGKMEIATKRIPAFVVGDGSSTIEKLIDELNKDPRRDLNSPLHILKPIVIDNQLTSYLKDQNLSLSSIPQKDQKIYVRKVASMSQGGITEDFTDQVNPQTKLVVETLATALHAFALGVDIICQDISKPLTPENGSIIECNTMPESYLNAFPVIGRQYPQIGKIVINGLMKDKVHTRKIVAIGLTLKELTEYIKLKLGTETNKIGLYSDGVIYINNEQISTKNECWRAVEALKLNASLSTIVLHYPSIDEVKENGLGFDKIDILLLSNKISKQDTNLLEGYKNLGFIQDIEVI